MRFTVLVVLLGLFASAPPSAAAQDKSIAVRDLVRLYNPDHERCHRTWEGVHQRVVDDPRYRPAREGEAAINVNYVCQEGRSGNFFFTVSLTMGYDVAGAVFMQMNQGIHNDEAEAVDAILGVIGEGLQALREARDEMDAMDEARWASAVAASGGNEHLVLARRQALHDLLD